MAIELIFVTGLISALPYILRHLDLFPANRSDELITILFIHGIVQVGLIVWSTSIAVSMTADIVEAGILASGNQNEGVITSVTTFVSKASTAGGLALSGILLGFVGFPAQASPENLTAEIISDLGFMFVIVTSALFALSLLFICYYRIDKSRQARW